MKIYFQLLKHNFLVYIQYPLEFVTILLKDFVKLFFFLILWSLILSELKNSNLNLTYIASYYLITGGIADLTMIFRQKFGAFLRKSIKSGYISNYLIKPIHLLPSMYAVLWGQRSVYNVSAIISIMIGFLLSPPSSLFNVVLFLFFLLISFGIGFAINLIEGVLTLHLDSPGGIMNSISHVARLLSGALIPLQFFPPGVRKMIIILPFASAVAAPIDSLNASSLSISVYKDLSIGLFWVIFLNLIVIYFWKKGLKKYEAVGL